MWSFRIRIAIYSKVVRKLSKVQTCDCIISILLPADNLKNTKLIATLLGHCNAALHSLLVDL